MTMVGAYVSSVFDGEYTAAVPPASALGPQVHTVDSEMPQSQPGRSCPVNAPLGFLRVIPLPASPLLTPPQAHPPVGAPSGGFYL